MRLVDADVIDKQIIEWIGSLGHGPYWAGYDDALCAVQDFIADMPTFERTEGKEVTINIC